MAWKNSTYRGPDIMVTLYRGTHLPWQYKSMRNGYLISNSQYQEKFPTSTGQVSLTTLLGPGDVGTNILFKNLPERELRNLHSQSSRRHSGDYESPNSKYVSLTSSKDIAGGFGEGTINYVFKFEIWRSDVWKGKCPMTIEWLLALSALPYHKILQVLGEQTPPDWDRGAEFEWLALGGTKIYNVRESNDGGTTFATSIPTVGSPDFWWEALF